MRYRILGPLSVMDGERQVTAGRDRAVLATLLLRANRIVALSELAEAVWGPRPPVTARNQLQNCVSRLRRVLPDGAILTDPAGYGIQAGPGDLDSAVFQRLVTAARAACDERAARAAYRQALDLWRGEACAGIDAPAVRQAAATLDEEHTLAVEDWVDLELADGHAEELVTALAALVERFPLRERLRGRLMLALHGAGRPDDALAEFRRASDTLRDELGIEPGENLRAAHREILSGTPCGAHRPIRCLPRTVVDFTGRHEVITRLHTGLRPEEPTVVAVDGMAGSGKTTVALHVAVLAGDRYPDAHLFVDLHGHSEQAPLDESAALHVLLRQLGLPAGDIPADLPARVARWRAEAARRRLLVVLDNAASMAQVAALLPGTPGSLTVVTSRRRLPGPAGARRESLPLLTTDEAATLLERIAGDRVRAEPEAAAEVVRRCGGLPLAVRLAGSRLAHRPRWRVADLLDRLTAAALPELAVENRTVVGAFALSYADLTAPAQRLFRLLGAHPGTTVDALAAAALTGLPLADGRALLAELADARLVDEPEPGIYRLHELLREYAAALPGPAGAAILGVLNLETHALMATMTESYRRFVARDLEAMPLLRPDLVRAVGDPAARLERLRGDLVRFVDAAIRAGQPHYAWWIPQAAWYALWYRDWNDDVAALNERGLAAARDHGDDEALAQMSNLVASSHYRAGSYEKALRHLRLGIDIRRRQRNLRALSVLTGNLAALHVAMERFTEAVDAGLECLRLRSLARMRVGPRVTMQLSIAYQRLGRWREALRMDRLGLLGALRPGDEHLRAGALVGIQRSRRALGEISPQAAQRYLEAALRMALRQRLALFEAETRVEIGNVLTEQDRYPEALDQHRRALDVAQRAGEVNVEADFRYDYATTLLRSGDVAAARAEYERSLAVARERRQPYAETRATAGLADCAALTG
ncbi:AfsR/SARP family transcriptional regulator [Actinoplanes philippinensis]|uniref:AfsR/SARP family transcriptional regulator n=1 Tax=Actinoplanes philippinensis TaxID=35752 RepID=UPI0033F7480F